MKDKILLLVIGLLLGAVIATGAFYVYSKSATSCECSSNNMGQNGGTPPEMPSGQSSENGQPPEMPSNNSQNNNETSSN